MSFIKLTNKSKLIYKYNHDGYDGYIMKTKVCIFSLESIIANSELDSRGPHIEPNWVCLFFSMTE